MNVKDKEQNKKNLELARQLKLIEKQEQKILNTKENTFLNSKLTPAVDKIQEKIPDKLITVLNSAFYKGFQLVFEKGNTIIEKTYNKDKIQLEYDINNYALDKKLSKKYMNKLDKRSNYSNTLNSSIAVLEGGVLGLLGIGLPDIPLFISVIVKTINEIALSYGYQYDTKEEKAYILYLICGAISKGVKQKDFDQKLESFGEKLDNHIINNIDLDVDMKLTAKILSDELLTAKFIQGIPIVGAVGGLVNYSIINRIGKYAKIKYKKRYLLSKCKDKKI